MIYKIRLHFNNNNNINYIYILIICDLTFEQLQAKIQTFYFVQNKKSETK